MGCFGNLIWVIFGGFAIAIEYFVAGFFMCCTIVGIPFGFQAFKLGIMALLPFGQEANRSEDAAGCLSIAMNIIWILIGGFWIALTHLLFGVLFCITIIGIPFGLQHFKLMKLAFSPFGRTITPSK
ncbi:MAG: YccF domain-containing protein [Bacteroidales bacterium]